MSVPTGLFSGRYADANLQAAYERAQDEVTTGLLDKARRWMDKGLLTRNQWAAVCALVFVQLPEDAPEVYAAVEDWVRRLAMDHPEWTER